MRFYSRTTGNCYISGLHAEMPVDAVEISDECFEAVIGNPLPGKVRSHDKSGFPILIDEPPRSSLEKAAEERGWRECQLSACQWLRERHRDEEDLGRPTSLGQERFIELLTYIQALRDWPQNPDFPDAQYRPPAPDWIGLYT